MANNTVLNAGSGGDTITTTDLTNFGSFGYSSTGKIACSALYISQATGTAPTPVSTSNALPVELENAIPAGTNAIGSVTIGAGTNAIGTVTTNADGALTAGTAPSKGFPALAQYNSTIPAPSNGQTLALQCDPTGNLYVSTEGRKATYSACSEGFALAASPTDIAQLAGSATKTVKIIRIAVQISASAAQSQIFPVLVIKRSSAGSGFSNTATVVPHDSNDAGATAVMSYTTANPTTGSKVGSVDGTYAPTMPNPPSSGASGAALRFAFEPKDEGGKPITLRGTSQTLAINLGGTALTAAPTAIVTYVWTEE